jgi:DNA-binding response OmpR family regulator
MGKKGKKLKVLFIGRDRKLFSALAKNAFAERQKVFRLQQLSKLDPIYLQRKADLVILDYPRLDENRVSLIKELCNRHKEKGFIVLSEQPPVEQVADLFKSGLDDLLAKPVEPARLERVVQQVAQKKGWVAHPIKKILASIGDRLRARRQELKFSLLSLSRRTGLSVSLLSQIERARSSASLASLYKICRALNLSMAALFAGL